MSSPQLPVPLPPSHSPLEAALWYVAPVITALGAWFVSQYSAVAQLQKTLLDASRLMVEETQKVHAADGARILILEAELVSLRGMMRQHQQWEILVRQWASRSALHLPEPEGRTEA